MPRLIEEEDSCKKQLVDTNMNQHLYDTGQISGYLPLEIALVHPGHGTHSFFRTEIPILHKVHKLKKDLKLLLKIAPEQQVWHFRGRPLEDGQTLFDVGVHKDDIITIKARPLPLDDVEEDKLDEATCLE